MKRVFQRKYIQRWLGETNPVKVGDIIEYPLRGKVWTVIMVNEKHVVMER